MKIDWYVEETAYVNDACLAVFPETARVGGEDTLFDVVSSYDGYTVASNLYLNERCRKVKAEVVATLAPYFYERMTK